MFKGAKKWPKHFFFNVPSTAEEKRLPSIETEEGNIALMPARHPAGAQTGQPKSPPTPPREGFPSHFSFPCLLPSRPRQKAASPPQKKNVRTTATQKRSRQRNPIQISRRRAAPPPTDHKTATIVSSTVIFHRRHPLMVPDGNKQKKCPRLPSPSKTRHHGWLIHWLVN